MTFVLFNFHQRRLGERERNSFIRKCIIKRRDVFVFGGVGRGGEVATAGW